MTGRKFRIKSVVTVMLAVLMIKYAILPGRIHAPTAGRDCISDLIAARRPATYPRAPTIVPCGGGNLVLVNPCSCVPSADLLDVDIVADTRCSCSFATFSPTTTPALLLSLTVPQAPSLSALLRNLASQYNSSIIFERIFDERGLGHFWMHDWDREVSVIDREVVFLLSDEQPLLPRYGRLPFVSNCGPPMGNLWNPSLLANHWIMFFGDSNTRQIVLSAVASLRAQSWVVEEYSIMENSNKSEFWRDADFYASQGTSRLKISLRFASSVQRMKLSLRDLRLLSSSNELIRKRIAGPFDFASPLAVFLSVGLWPLVNFPRSEEHLICSKLWGWVPNALTQVTTNGIFLTNYGVFQRHHTIPPERVTSARLCVESMSIAYRFPLLDLHRITSAANCSDGGFHFTQKCYHIAAQIAIDMILQLFVAAQAA